jgi:hypothetical protein
VNVVLLDGDVSYPPTLGKRLRTLNLMPPLARRQRLVVAARGDRAGLGQSRALLAEAARWPGWARAAALLARLEEAEGRRTEVRAGWASPIGRPHGRAGAQRGCPRGCGDELS